MKCRCEKTIEQIAAVELRPRDTTGNDGCYYSVRVSRRGNRTDSMARTTNACEAFHASFNANFYSAHPNIFVFMQVLETVQIDSNILLNSTAVPKPFKNATRTKMHFIAQQIRRYRQNEISLIKLIKILAYKNVPRLAWTLNTCVQDCTYDQKLNTRVQECTDDRTIFWDVNQFASTRCILGKAKWTGPTGRNLT